jgi:hypothetical protein
VAVQTTKACSARPHATKNKNAAQPGGVFVVRFESADKCF